MAALTFPVNPVDGELYPDPPIQGVNVYRYDAAYNTWRLLGVASGVSAGTYGNNVTCIEVTVTPTGVISDIVNRPIPTSSTGVLGLSSPGIGLDANAGVYDLLPPFAGNIGGVKQGANVTIASDGAISVATASTTVPGIVRLNNTLSSTSTTQALTALQGKVLQDQIDSLTVEGLTFCGAYDAGTSEMVYVSTAGFSRGFAVGDNLPAPNPNLAGDFVIVSSPGVPAPPAPSVVMAAGDWILYDDSSNAWVHIPIGSNILANQVIFNPYGSIASTNVQGAIEELDDQFTTLAVTFNYVDDISSQFNGVTTTFNLTVGGSPFILSGSNLAVFIGGVFQEPGPSYTVTADQITFSEAPLANSSFAGIYGASGSQGGGAGGGGTVTSVGTGTGLVGGPITTTGTISLVPATDSTIGGVKPDGSTTTVSADGTLTALVGTNYWQLVGNTLSPIDSNNSVQVLDINANGAVRSQIGTTGVYAGFDAVPGAMHLFGTTDASTANFEFYASGVAANPVAIIDDLGGVASQAPSGLAGALFASDFADPITSNIAGGIASYVPGASLPSDALITGKNISLHSFADFADLIPEASLVLSNNAFQVRSVSSGVSTISADVTTGDVSIGGSLSFNVGGAGTSLTLPTVRGTAGQVLITNGDGTTSWGTGGGGGVGTLQQVTTAGNTTFNSIKFVDPGSGISAVDIDPQTSQVILYPQSVGDPGLYLTPSAAFFGNSTGSFYAAGLVPASLDFNGFAGTSIKTATPTVPVQLWAGGQGGVATPQVSVTGTATTISNDLQMAGNILVPASQSIRFFENSGTSHVALRAPATIPSSFSLTLPSNDGSAGQVLSTDGTGDLSWVTTATVVAAPASSATAGTQGQIAFGTGFFYWHDGTQWLRVAGTTF